MISKKSRKVVAALLIGATICASGTFAYFNDKLDLSSVVKTDDASSKLNITNGHVEIIGQINGQQSAATNIWSYDVTRLSTVDSFGISGDKFAAAIKNKYATLNSVDTYAKAIAIASSDSYVLDNLSPDILGVKSDDGAEATDTSGTENINYSDLKAKQADVVTKQKAVENAQTAYNNAAPADKQNRLSDLNTAKNNLKAAETALYAISRLTRANVGDPVVNYISYARPGDAFVLGTAKSDGKEASGLEIVNKSNITTKVGLTPKGAGTSNGNIDDSTLDKAKEQLALLENAGYKFYIKTVRLNAAGTEVDLTTGKDIDGNTYKAQDYQQFKSATITADNYKGLLLSNVKPNETLRVNIRVELPLDATNYYQDRKTSDDTYTTGFDVTQLFDVVVTQENNPGWNENGTNDTPVIDNATKTPTFN